MNTDFNSRANIRSFLLTFGAIFTLVTIPLTVFLVINSEKATRNPKAEVTWAFEELFTGSPTGPSQSLLPKAFDYIVTNRQDVAEASVNNPDGGDSTGSFGSFPADHGNDCSPPNAQHNVDSRHRTNTSNPDESFFICKDHMMSSFGHLTGYGVSSFWPRQEFDFTGGGTLEWDVNLVQDGQKRSWFEVMIVPKEQLQISAAHVRLPIDETYPKDYITVRMFYDQKREIFTGKDIVGANGENSYYRDAAPWGSRNSGDPALNDRKIRRKNQLEISNNQIIWRTEKADGSFDVAKADVPNGVPIKKGLVVFKTHAYTPQKDANYDKYTFHWDNIRFSGPKLTPYESYFANPGVMGRLSGVGATSTQTVNLTRVGANTAIAGQLNYNADGVVKLSINGGLNIDVKPHSPENSCQHPGWNTFRIPVNPSQLKVGANTFKWTVGSPPCQTWANNYEKSFSVKAMHVQMDASGTVDIPPPPPPAVDTTPPTVSLTSPVAGNVSGTVNITATAVDNVGVSKVEFYDGTSLIFADTSSPYSTNWNTTTLTNGSSHDLVAKATDTTGNMATSAVIKVVINNDTINPPPPPPPSSGVGFTATYFAGKNNFSGTPLATRTENNINLDWGYGSSLSGVPTDNFSVRWTGTINFESDKYRLNVKADDGIRIYVDNVLVKFVSKSSSNQAVLVGAYKNQAPTLYNGILDMAGKAGNHTIRVEYYEDAGQAMAKVNWVKHLSCYDLTEDFGVVNNDDLDRAARFFGVKTNSTVSTLPWAVNGDKSVSVIDLSLIAKKSDTTCQ